MIQEIAATKPVDRYSWLVRYRDGTTLAEYDNEQQDGRGFAEVEQEQVQSVILLGQGTREVYSAVVPQGAMPVFFRRRRVEVNPFNEKTKMSTTHCIGWKAEESAAYLFISGDGLVSLISDPQAV